MKKYLADTSLGRRWANLFKYKMFYEFLLDNIDKITMAEISELKEVEQSSLMFSTIAAIEKIEILKKQKIAFQLWE